MTRQKLTSLLLAGTMLVPLTGCGNSTPAETQPEIVETEPAETYTSLPLLKHWRKSMRTRITADILSGL